MLELAGRVVVALWHVVGLLLVLALLIEFVPNAWQRLSRLIRYRRSDRPDSAAVADAQGDADWAVGYFDEFGRAVRVDWRAYVGWWQRPFRGAYVTLDRRGLRPTPGEERVDPGTVRILCFGGSTMMGMGARDDRTIPARLAVRLGELGHRAALTNYGQLGHNSTQELITLQQLLRAGMKFDIALFYDGANDITAAEQTGRAGGLLNEQWRRAEFTLLLNERRRDLFAVASLSAIPRTLRRLRRLTGAPLLGPLPEPEADLLGVDLRQLAREVLDVYSANQRMVRLLAVEYGFRPVFYWQPAITTKRIKSADEKRFEADHTRDVAARRALTDAVFDEYRRRIAAAGLIDTVDLSALFDEVSSPVYIDMVHLSEAGNDTVAEAMAPKLAALLNTPPPRPS
jgi:lysophospholipase L1-like esterase